MIDLQAANSIHFHPCFLLLSIVSKLSKSADEIDGGFNVFVEIGPLTPSTDIFSGR